MITNKKLEKAKKYFSNTPRFKALIDRAIMDHKNIIEILKNDFETNKNKQLTNIINDCFYSFRITKLSLTDLNRDINVIFNFVSYYNFHNLEIPEYYYIENKKKLDELIKTNKIDLINTLHELEYICRLFKTNINNKTKIDFIKTNFEELYKYMNEND